MAADCWKYRIQEDDYTDSEYAKGYLSYHQCRAACEKIPYGTRQVNKPYYKRHSIQQVAVLTILR